MRYGLIRHPIVVFLLLHGVGLSGQSFSTSGTPNLATSVLAEREISAEPCKTVSESITVQHRGGASSPPRLQVLSAFGWHHEELKAATAQAATYAVEVRGGGELLNTTCSYGQSAFVSLRIVEQVPQLVPTQAAYPSPDPDLRVALNIRPVQDLFGNMKHYKLGCKLQIKDFVPTCPDRCNFDIILTDKPALAFAGSFNPDGTYGTYLSAAATARPQIHENCVGNTYVDVHGNAAASIGSLSSTSVGINGSFSTKLIVHFAWPFNVTLPMPEALSSAPIKLADSPNASLEFGTFKDGQWTPSPTPKEKALPFRLHASSIGGPSGNDSTLLIDGFIGAAERQHNFSTFANARDWFLSDRPLEAITGGADLGVTLRDSFIGEAGVNNTGLLGALLPIKITTGFDWRFLFIHLAREIELVADAGAARVVMHEDRPAIEVSLTAKVLRVLKPDGSEDPNFLLKGVTARLLLDRLRFEADTLRFRVAGFRVFAKTSWFIFPVTLSSGALEQSLNNGSIDMTGKLRLDLALPKCLPANSNGKILSCPQTCGVYEVYDHLGYRDGPLGGSLSLLPDTLVVRRFKATVEDKSWSGLQAAVKAQVQ